MKNKGFSLVEVLLVLGFAAVLIAGAFLAYSQVKSSNSVNSEVQAVSTMIAGIRSLYTGSPNYSGLTAQIMINAGIVPENKIEGNSIKHDLGGQDQRISVRDSNGSTTFAITYRGVPKDKCAKFISAIAPSVNAVGTNTSGNNIKSWNEDISAIKIANFCDINDTESVNITLTGD